MTIDIPIKVLEENIEKTWWRDARMPKPIVYETVTIKTKSELPPKNIANRLRRELVKKLRAEGFIVKRKTRFTRTPVTLKGYQVSVTFDVSAIDPYCLIVDGSPWMNATDKARILITRERVSTLYCYEGNVPFKWLVKRIKSLLKSKEKKEIEKQKKTARQKFLENYRDEVLKGLALTLPDSPPVESLNLSGWDRDTEINYGQKEITLKSGHRFEISITDVNGDPRFIVHATSVLVDKRGLNHFVRAFLEFQSAEHLGGEDDEYQMVIFKSQWELNSDDLDDENNGFLSSTRKHMERTLVQDMKRELREQFEQLALEILEDGQLHLIDQLVIKDQLMQSLERWAQKKWFLSESLLQYLFSPLGQPEEIPSETTVGLIEEIVQHPWWPEMAEKRYMEIWRWRAATFIDPVKGSLPV